ncbi:hypothetical protein GCM10009836_73300 [Pseudonocardia ailaonensis]|uniref:DUF1269 domain-containing protein n=1 Tax=Pseudonocardia ailaonensis TaxID=367279 RepID=A0ABN2NRF0_9PSEU
MTGPVEWVALAFPGETVDPAVVPEIARLVDAGTVRILDLLLVHRSVDGAVSVTEYDSLDGPVRAALDAVDGDVLGLLGEVDLPVIAEELAPDSTALVVVWESLWAAGLAEAVRGAGGLLLTHDRIPADTVDAALAATDGVVS